MSQLIKRRKRGEATQLHAHLEGGNLGHLSALSEGGGRAGREPASSALNRRIVKWVRARRILRTDKRQYLTSEIDIFSPILRVCFPAVQTHRAIKDTHCIAPIVMEELLPAYVYYLTRNKGRTRVRRSRPAPSRQWDTFMVHLVLSISRRSEGPPRRRWRRLRARTHRTMSGIWQIV